MPDNIFFKFVEYIWIPILAMLGHLYLKLFGVDSRATLLENQQSWHEKQRLENKASRDEQRKEILRKIDSHNEAVMKRIDRLEEKIVNGK